MDEYKHPSYSLSKEIKQTKRQYRGKVELQFYFVETPDNHGL